MNHQVEGGFLLNLVVDEGGVIFQFLIGEDKTLLDWRNTLAVLDLGLHVVDGVRKLKLNRDGIFCDDLGLPSIECRLLKDWHPYGMKRGKHCLSHILWDVGLHLECEVVSLKNRKDEIGPILDVAVSKGVTVFK